MCGHDFVLGLKSVLKRIRPLQEIKITLHISINFLEENPTVALKPRIFYSLHFTSKNLMMLQKLRINFSRRLLPPWDSQWYLLNEDLHDNFSWSSAASMITFFTSIMSIIRNEQDDNGRSHEWHRPCRPRDVYDSHDGVDVVQPSVHQRRHLRRFVSSSTRQQAFFRRGVPRRARRESRSSSKREDEDGIEQERSFSRGNIDGEYLGLGQTATEFDDQELRQRYCCLRQEEDDAVHGELSKPTVHISEDSNSDVTSTHQSMLTTCPDAVEPNLSCNKVYDTGISCPTDRHGESRSAFTKVNLAAQRNGFNDDGQTSPRSSISPDDRTGYQSSVSPPVVPLTATTGYKYAPFPTKMTYPFLVSPEGSQPGLLENLKISQIAQPPKVPSPKMPSFRPDLPPVYPNLPYNPISVFPPMADALTRPRFLATAAGVAGLLPSSFAALTLPAQNVCAKCNLSFRMTSDLVYHMRSHHKNENSAEAARRRREEKLRCPVCDESFRERHHLTRHMTAHQDKESDAIVDQVEVKRRATTVHSK
ncbi:hypothetical protein E2986_11107 [Frieseomelitta varia]|uniref:C2H2-type domain-containing protein n=1 Tax=Frieseomelitta varia TaxID=561572 RepID=A0A833SIW8_9HYME|nr:hypothetical protein E2986_11107 [Frieseomelitta varia]